MIGIWIVRLALSCLISFLCTAILNKLKQKKLEPISSDIQYMVISDLRKSLDMVMATNRQLTKEVELYKECIANPKKKVIVPVPLEFSHIRFGSNGPYSTTIETREMYAKDALRLGYLKSNAYPLPPPLPPPPAPMHYAKINEVKNTIKQLEDEVLNVSQYELNEQACAALEREK